MKLVTGEIKFEEYLYNLHPCWYTQDVALQVDIAMENVAMLFRVDMRRLLFNELKKESM